MSNRLLLILGLSTTLLSTPAAAQSAQDAALRADIAQRTQKFAADYNANNIAAVAAAYTADGQLMVPGYAPFVGRDAINGAMTGLRGTGASLQLETVEVEGFGDTAWETGTHVLTTPDGQVYDRGTYLVVWKRQDGEWRLHRDVIHSTMPHE